VSDELKPLTEEEAAEFEMERQTDLVIQRKCDACQAWYETTKKSIPFTERFICDCGNPMEYNVPASPVVKIIKPDTADILSLGDLDDRLDTGMKVKEAIHRASQWWESTGRAEMITQKRRQAKPVGGADKGAGASFASDDEDNINFLPSGLLHGKPWAELTRNEQIRVVKSWHHFHIRNPDVIGADPEQRHKMQDRGKIN